MKFAAGFLGLFLASPAALPSWTPLPSLPQLPDPVVLAPAPEPSGQEWLADPILPAQFRLASEPVETTWPDEALSLDVPPLAVLSANFPQEPPAVESLNEGESSFPRGITALDIQAWREEDDLRLIREWTGDALFGVPILVPQLVLEAFLPRGINVGPATFLHRTSSSSIALIVLDQVLFHEAEFLARAQARAADEAYSEDLTRGQRRVLRKALAGGFRATYAMPGLTMDLVLETATDHGVAGYLLAPAIGGALLYFKGIDHRIRLHDDVKLRLKIASGREWTRGMHSEDGLSALSFDLRFCDFPLGVIGSFDVTSRGMVPAFIGLGTSLDAIEDLLILEKRRVDPDYRDDR